MIEQIYSRQELIARFELRSFIHFIGTPTIPSKSNTPRGITSGELLDAFSIKHDNPLTSEIVDMYLTAGGFVPYEERQTKLYLKIDVENFAKLSLAEQNKVIKWVDGPICITLRKLMLGYTKNPKENPTQILETPLTIFMKRFIKYYCIDDRTHYGPLLSTETRASTKQLYSYYITMCASLNYQNPLGLRKFIEFIRALGYHVQKGYVRGVSGINYVVHIHIPQTEDDLRESILYGMGIITTKEHRITTDMMFKEYSTVALQELHHSRKERMLDVKADEQTTASQSKEAEEAQSGRALEFPTNRNADGKDQTLRRGSETSIPKKQDEITETTEIHISDDSGTRAISKTLQTEHAENEAGRTSDGSIRDTARSENQFGDTVIGSETDIAETPKSGSTNQYVSGGAEPVRNNRDISDNVSISSRASTSSYQRRGPVQILRANNSSGNGGTETEYDLDPMAGKAELLNGAPEEEQEEVNLDIIAEALKIPLLTMYDNDPMRMSREDMNNYLKLMHLDICIDDVYEQLIQKLS